MQDRIELFKAMGFECVGGEVAPGFYDTCVADLLEANLYIWVDFINKRVFLDCGDESDPFILRGDFTKQEIVEYLNYKKSKRGESHGECTCSEDSQGDGEGAREAN